MADDICVIVCVLPGEHRLRLFCLFQLVMEYCLGSTADILEGNNCANLNSLKIMYIQMY